MNVYQLLHDALNKQKQGDLDAAISVYNQILQFDPRNADAHHLLGCAYKSRYQFDEAIVSISVAIALQAKQGIFFNSLGSAYMGKDEVVAARLCFEHALALNPDYDDALSNLGLNLIKQGLYEEAVPLLERLMLRFPQHDLAQINLGRAYLMVARYQDALNAYQKVLDRNNANYAGRVGQAMVLNQMGDTDAALNMINQVPEKDLAQSLEGVKLKATLLEVVGRLDDACAAYDAGIAAFPNNLDLPFARVMLRKVRADEPIFAKMEALGPHLNKLSASSKAETGFAIGKCYQDIGDIDTAARYYATGASAKLQTIVYSEENDIKFAARLQQTMTAEYLENIRRQGLSSDRPIFIVGMPRSGTTLTEQILASHPDVYPGGELIHIPEAVNNYDFGNGVVINHSLVGSLEPKTSIQDRAAYYLQQLDKLPGIGKQAHVTDKLPGNSYMIGLISSMFPNARIIHCRRDPIDNCISCYITMFTHGHEWSYDLAMLGRAYRRYWDVMAHWRKVLSGRFLEVRYEEVVDDIEASARRLLDWCGLEWDPRVLQFHETQRSVKTASIAQVRQPIYNSSVGRWKKWAPHIQPLLAELGDIEQQYWAEIGK